MWVSPIKKGSTLIIQSFFMGAASTLGEIFVTEVYTIARDPLERAFFLDNLKRSKKKLAKILEDS